MDCDLADRGQVELMAKTVKDRYGDVDMLVNNAGVMPVGSLLNMSSSVIETTFHVNILSHFWVRSSQSD